MAEVEVRPLTDLDADGYWRVRVLTYHEGKMPPPEERIVRFGQAYVARKHGDVQGIYSLLDTSCTRGKAVVPCGGVAMVGVLPSARRSGVGSEMMRGSLRLMREQGIPMAALYAFRETYYRRFGYESCGTKVELTVPTHRLPELRPDLDVRVIEPTSPDLIHACHETFVTQRSGLCLRNAMLWNRCLGETKTIYVAGDPIEAYAVIQHRVAFFEEQTVDELVWTTRRGYDAMIDLFKGLGINKKCIRWSEPSDSPYRARFVDESVEMHVKRSAMYRAIDVPALLRALPATDAEPFTLHVDDEVICENRGPWRVDPRSDGWTVEPATEAALYFTPQSFVQAYLGEPSLESLARNGLVEVRDARSLRSAQRALPPLPTSHYDFF